MSSVPGVQGPSNSSYPNDGAGVADPTAPLLPLPAGAVELTGDIGEQLALLVMKSAAASKKAHRAAQEADEKSQAAEEDAQVGAMRQEASHEYDAGWTEGALGGASLLGASMGGMVSGGGQAVGKLVEKGADIGLDVAKRFDAADQKTDEANAKQHEFAADKAKREVDRMKDSLADDQKTLDAAVQFVKEFKATRDQALLNITRRA
jgi:hypothetical protein